MDRCGVHRASCGGAFPDSGCENHLQEEEKAKVWKGISNGTIALSVGLGINFFVQLGRYIFAVDAVLPEDIKD